MLISMGFVFITMVELAFVLLVKQFQDWKGTSATICNAALKPEQLIPEGKTRDNKVIDSIKEKRTDETDSSTGVAMQVNLWNTKTYSFHELPLTTRIDFVGFFLFLLSYFIVNVIYWKKISEAMKNY